MAIAVAIARVIVNRLMFSQVSQSIGVEAQDGPIANYVGLFTHKRGTHKRGRGGGYRTSSCQVAGNRTIGANRGHR